MTGSITDETWSADPADWLHNPHAGEMLASEFMEPLGMDAAALAEASEMPVGRIEAVIAGDAALDAELDLRLARYFRMSEGFFLRLQNQHDLLEAKRKRNGELDRITPRAARAAPNSSPSLNHSGPPFRAGRNGSGHMGIVAQLYRDARHGERYPVELEATLRDADSAPFDAAIADLSVSGFRVSVPAELKVGDQIAIGISGIGVRTARVVRSEGTVHGCEFLMPLTNPELATALEAPPAELIPWPGNVSVTRVEAKSVQPSVVQLTALSLFGLVLVGGFGWAVIAATRALL